MKLKKPTSKVWILPTALTAVVAASAIAVGISASQNKQLPSDSTAPAALNADFSQYPSVPPAGIRNAVSVVKEKLNDLYLEKTADGRYLVRVPKANSLGLAQSAFLLKRLLFLRIHASNSTGSSSQTNLLTYVPDQQLASVRLVRDLFESGVDVTTFFESQGISETSTFSVSASLMAASFLLPEGVQNDSSGAFHSSSVRNDLITPPADLPVDMSVFEEAFTSNNLLSYDGPWQKPVLSLNNQIVTWAGSDNVDFLYRFADASDAQQYNLADFNVLIGNQGWDATVRPIELTVRAKAGKVLSFSDQALVKQLSSKSYVINNPSRSPLILKLLKAYSLVGTTRNPKLVGPLKLAGVEISFSFDKGGALGLEIPAHLQRAHNSYTPEDFLELLAAPTTNLDRVLSWATGWAVEAFYVTIIDRTTSIQRNYWASFWTYRTNKLIFA